MRTTWMPDVQARPRRIAIGEFDGVHLGHRAVIGDADTVVTFEPHPRSIVTPDRAPKRLAPLPVKADLIANLGVRELVVVGFDADRAAQSAQEFIDEVIVERLGATEVRVGANFRFGRGAEGDGELLRAQPGFTAIVHELIRMDGEVVSSTRIRAMIEAGEIEAATRSLGLPFHLRGIVAKGEQRGRTLGFPTANLVPDDSVCYPADGVYACRAAIGSEWWPAAVSIGVRPMFDTELGRLVEAYLIGFEGECYGEELRLAFLDRLRGEQRFASVDALVSQMQADVDRTKAIAG
jgi:riboflavin kinase/FMN adenylyltransferase